MPPRLLALSAFVFLPFTLLAIYPFERSQRAFFIFPQFYTINMDLCVKKC
ncbi:exported protein of unknown function [Limnospira indica PCC 8005]|uniref:Uncharacterized protein n=1 Tax=Limnospira indica PCC 8005 TaxID=376219 RepID=A0A9P1KJG8_9CYAN|nr:exported protein of unknown function [Limnospira indica PCC 8005]